MESGAGARKELTHVAFEHRFAVVELIFAEGEVVLIVVVGGFAEEVL